MGQSEGIAIDNTLKDLFISETHEQIEKFVEVLLMWEQNPHNQSAGIDNIFRMAHNIKGSSGMMGLNDLKEVMHIVENMFDEVRNNKLVLDSEKIDLLLQFSDHVLAYVEGGNWEDASDIARWEQVFSIGKEESMKPRQELEKAEKADVPLKLTIQEKKQVAQWQETGKHVYGIDVQFPPDVEMKGAYAIAFIKYLEKYGTVFKTVPDTYELVKEEFVVLKIVLLTGNPLVPDQENVISAYIVCDNVKPRIRKWIYRSDEGETITKAERQFEQTVRVELSKIDSLVNNVGELLTVKASLLQIYRHGSPNRITWNQLGKLLQQLEQVVGLFQVEVMDLRMVPVRQLFSRFPKIVRDISKQTGKFVEVSFFGEETELDKHVAEQLVDPLVHLIRNAVDHGIENEEQRLSVSKPGIGKIVLGAYQEGDYIVISIADDGQGLDLDKIRNKAIKNGLIKPDTLLTEDETTKLIFQPGFSTADKVSDISGRGVGLDVVQNSIKALKGDIETESAKNRGTTFRLKVPLTLAIIQAFMVKIGGQIFGIPSADVVESLAITTESLHLISGKQFYILRKEAIPIVNIGQLFNMETTLPEINIPLIIIRNGRSKLGLLVEELVGQEEVMIKQINKALSDNPVIAGASLLGSGEIALILNAHQIISRTISK